MEIVRKGWEAWLGGDIDALAALWDPDVVWDITHFRDWPETEYHGEEGIRKFLTDWLEIWDEYEVGVDEVLAVPDGRVVSLFWHRGKGRESGIAMELRSAQITAIRNGKMIRIDNYDDRDEALEAAGLSE